MVGLGIPTGYGRKERRMVQLFKALLGDTRAATTAEYAILIVLIAAVIVFAVKGLGSTMNTLYFNVNSSLAAAMGS
jgi:Flp pilus assembly pilin Flp